MENKAATASKSHNAFRLTALLSLCGIAIVYTPLILGLAAIRREDAYSFIPLVPLISGFFVFRILKSSPLPGRHPAMSGIIPIAAAATLYLAWFLLRREDNRVEALGLLALSFVSAIFGLTALTSGWRTVFRLLFPLLFLLFIVPLPPALLSPVITYLQHGSSEIVNIIFAVSGISYLRDGLVYDLPTISLYIAEECSGIRSTLSLVIVTIVAGQITLGSPWRKAVLALWILPVSIIKNGIRIATLGFLATWVDNSFVTDGFLHKQGGFIFFGISLVITFAMLGFLRHTESGKRKEASVPVLDPATIPPEVSG